MRVDRDQLFMSIATDVAERSTCRRAHVGAVIVIDRHVVSMGYNGSPPKQPHCYEVGCLEGPDGGCVRTTHAELNAVAFAARRGIPCDEGTMYCTHATCATCARAMVAAGIIEVVYLKPYRLIEGLELLDKCNVRVRQFDGGSRKVPSDADRTGQAASADRSNLRGTR